MKQKKKTVEDRSDQALDYYYRGIRIDNRHFGCCFNIALIFLNKIKLNNAYKWFKMAIKINPESKEAYIGVSISALKLGKYEECINFIEQRPGQSVDDIA